MPWSHLSNLAYQQVGGVMGIIMASVEFRLVIDRATRMHHSISELTRYLDTNHCGQTDVAHCGLYINTLWFFQASLIYGSILWHFSSNLARMFLFFLFNLQQFVKLGHFVLPLFSVLHCRCAKCFSVPARKRVRKRVTTQTLLSLPEEVILCVLQCLSAEDLLAVRAVSSFN